MLAKVTGDWDDIKGGLAAISSIWGTFATNLTRIDESIASTTHDLEQEGKVWQHVRDDSIVVSARGLCVTYLQAYLRQLKLMQTIYAALSKMLVVRKACHAWQVGAWQRRRRIACRSLISKSQH